MNLDSWYDTAPADLHGAVSAPQLSLQIREELRRALTETLDRLLPQLLRAGAAPAAIGSTPAHCTLLTQREREILARIAAGDSNKQIARRLSLSLHTVKRHVANILCKLDVSSRVQAAAWARACH